jgi:hypothetical protein
MIGVGAGMYAFDIDSVEDLRRKVRGGLGVDGTGRSEKEVEEELEEWVVGVLGRKTEKEKQREQQQRMGGDGENLEERSRWRNEKGKER